MSQEWLSALSDLTQTLRALLPNLVAAAALVLLGLLLARLLRHWSRRLTAAALEKLGRNATIKRALEGTEVTSAIPRVVAAFIFWLVLLFFAAVALEALGLPVVTDSLGRFVYYLPNVLAATLIVAAGLVVGTVVRGMVAAAASSAGIAFSAILGRLGHGIVLLIAIVIALDELGIDSSALIVLLTVVSGSVLAGLGLAFGLGAHTAVSNIIASRYLTGTYQTGQTVRIGEIEGRVIETTTTAVILATEAGRVMVPAKKFSEESSMLITEAS